MSEANNSVEQVVIPEDVLHLCRFLAKLWWDIDCLRYEAAKMATEEEMKDFLIMKWPVVQGTKNQIDLKKIGDQPYDSAKIREAVNWMLKG